MVECPFTAGYQSVTKYRKMVLNTVSGRSSLGILPMFNHMISMLIKFYGDTGQIAVEGAAAFCCLKWQNNTFNLDFKQTITGNSPQKAPRPVEDLLYI
jgi:hypothetical protein